MLENRMTLEGLERKRDFLQFKIEAMSWIDEELDEVEDDQKAIYRHPLTELEKELRKVQKEIDHWYDF